MNCPGWDLKEALTNYATEAMYIVNEHMHAITPLLGSASTMLYQQKL
jgi:hypothetical protein